MPLNRLRPLAWAHARPGAIRTDGSGNIESIETGAPKSLSQSTSSVRPAIGNVLSRPTIRLGLNKQLTFDTYDFIEQCSLLVLWWQRAGEGPLVKIEDINQNRAISIEYSLFELAFGLIGSGAQSIAVAQDKPYLATIASGGSSGPFRVGATSTTVSGSFNSEDAVVNITSDLYPCDYFEIVAFDRELDVTQLELAEGIVAWANGFPEVLGGGHRFRSRPPMIGD